MQVNGFKRFRWAAQAIALGGVMAVQAGTAEARDFALVFGNGAYDQLSPLASPSRNASELSEVLRRLDFDVLELANGNLGLMRAVLGTFARRAGAEDTAVLYFSGYALQRDGRNYLLPVSAQIDGADQIAEQAVPLDQAIDALSGVGRLVVIVDACRSSALTGTVASGEGLADANPPKGGAIVLAAQPGMACTEPDTADGFSPFTSALMTHLPQRDLAFADLMESVSADVQAASGGAQRPFSRLDLVEPLILRPDEGMPQFEIVESNTEIVQPEPDIDPAQLPRLVQTELKRLGCYSLRVDGDWGPGSRRALERYLKAMGRPATRQELTAMMPSEELYREAAAQEEGLCPPVIVTPTRTTTSRPSTSNSAPAAPAPKAPAAAAPAPASEERVCTLFGRPVKCGSGPKTD
jgi:hypothetical protein